MLYVPAWLQILQRNTSYWNTPVQSKYVKLLNTIKGRVGIVSQCTCMLDFSFLFHIKHLLLSEMSLGVLHNPRAWPTTSNSGKERVSFNRKKPCEGPGSHRGTVLLMVKDIVHDFQEVWFCLHSCCNSWTSSSTSPNLWTVKQKCGLQRTKKKKNETHFPCTLSAGAPVSGVLCGPLSCTFLSITHSPSAHSLPRLFPILSIWISFGSNTWTSSASAVCRAAAQSEAVGLDWITAPQLPELNWLRAFSS